MLPILYQIYSIYANIRKSPPNPSTSSGRGAFALECESAYLFIVSSFGIMSSSSIISFTAFISIFGRSFVMAAMSIFSGAGAAPILLRLINVMEEEIKLRQVYLALREKQGKRQ